MSARGYYARRLLSGSRYFILFSFSLPIIYITRSANQIISNYTTHYNIYIGITYTYIYYIYISMYNTSVVISTTKWKKSRHSLGHWIESSHESNAIGAHGRIILYYYNILCTTLYLFLFVGRYLRRHCAASTVAYRSFYCFSIFFLWISCSPRGIK